MNVLTLDQVRAKAPAAFATSPRSGVSARYAHVNTATILETLQKDGWQITGARQGRTLKHLNGLAFDTSDRALHRSHEIRLAHPSIPEIRGTRVEAILGNSSDTSSAVVFYAGAFRTFCQNGLVVGDVVAGHRAYHRGANLIDQVQGIAGNLLQDFGRVTAAIDVWSQRSLAPSEQVELANKALELRFPGEQVEANPFDLLSPRRSADTGSDLWTVFNRVQESAVGGGFSVTRKIEHPADGATASWSESVRRKARKIAGLGQSRRLNRELWNLATTYAN